MKYSIIYADPPWSYKWGNGGKWAPERQYQTMALEEICAMPIKQLREKNCVLALWVTGPHLPSGLEVMNAWGFKYKTILFNWVKLSGNGNVITGMGSYTRHGSELCLLGMRGHVKRKDDAKSIKQVVFAERKHHSKKPDCFRNMIVDLFGNLPRLELFARNNVQGWDVFGNEVDGSIRLPNTTCSGLSVGSGESALSQPEIESVKTVGAPASR